MRKVERIDKFCNELAKIWKENCPDWRFGQLMCNVLNSMTKDPFFPEEDEMLEYFKNYFAPSDDVEEVEC
jgi:hypothetical protein